MLLELLRTSTQEEIARRCRCSQSLISRLASGATTDSYRLRKALERVGIAPDAWDQPAPASNMLTSITGSATPNDVTGAGEDRR